MPTGGRKNKQTDGRKYRKTDGRELNFPTNPQDDESLIDFWEKEVDEEKRIKSGAMVTVGVLTRNKEITSVREHETMKHVYRYLDKRYQWKLIAAPEARHTAELKIESLVAESYEMKVEIQIISKNRNGKYRINGNNGGIECIRYVLAETTNTLKIKFDGINFPKNNINLYIRITVLPREPPIYDKPDEANTHYEIITADGSVYFKKANRHRLPEFLRIMLENKDSITIRDVSRDTVFQALDICEDYGRTVHGLYVYELWPVLHFFERYTPIVGCRRFTLIDALEAVRFPEYISRKFAKIRYGELAEVDKGYFDGLADIKEKYFNKSLPFSARLEWHKDICCQLYFYKSIINGRAYISFGMYMYRGDLERDYLFPNNLRVPIKVRLVFHVGSGVSLSICRVLTSDAPSIGCPTLMPWEEYSSLSGLSVDQKNIELNVEVIISRIEENDSKLRRIPNGEPFHIVGEQRFVKREDMDLIEEHCSNYDPALFYSSSQSPGVYDERISRIFYDILYHGTADITREDIVPLLVLAQEVGCTWVKEYIGQALYYIRPIYPKMKLSEEEAQLYQELKVNKDVDLQQVEEILEVIKLQKDRDTEIDETRDDVCVVYSKKGFVPIDELT